MLEELINVYEEVKKYVYVVDRGTVPPLIIKFNNANFYHLIGLHKLKMDMFFPSYMKSKDKRYKYMKKNVKKYNNIIINQINKKDSLELRMYTFINLANLLSGTNTLLYNLKDRTAGSMYNGDYGLLKTYEEYFCLLGLKLDDYEEQFLYAPQSWMASRGLNRLVTNKAPKYYDQIIAIPSATYTSYFNDIYLSK